MKSHGNLVDPFKNMKCLLKWQSENGFSRFISVLIALIVEKLWDLPILIWYDIYHAIKQYYHRNLKPDSIGSDQLERMGKT